MFGFDGVALAGMTLAIFIGGLSKGISGVALPITTLGIALIFVDAQVGLALIALPLLVTNIWQALGSGDILTPIKRFWPSIAIFLIGLVVGASLINELDQRSIVFIIGVSAIVFSVSQLWKPSSAPLSPRAERIAGPIACAIGGTMGGLTSVWGPPIMMFMFRLHLDKDLWVRSITGFYLLGSIMLAILYVRNGVLDGENMWLSAAACVPAMIGILLGTWIRRYINDLVFRRILLLALFVIGLNMIRRAIF